MVSETFGAGGEMAHGMLVNKIIHAEAAAGAHIRACAREAALLALERECVVKFTHNGSTYVADPVVILGAVLRSDK